MEREEGRWRWRDGGGAVLHMSLRYILLWVEQATARFRNLTTNYPRRVCIYRRAGVGMITLQIIILLCENFKLICKYLRGEVKHFLFFCKNKGGEKKKTDLKIRSSTSDCPQMLKLDYEAFVIKTGSKLKPSQNTAINGAWVSRNNA